MSVTAPIRCCTASDKVDGTRTCRGEDASPVTAVVHARISLRSCVPSSPRKVARAASHRPTCAARFVAIPLKPAASGGRLNAARRRFRYRNGETPPCASCRLSRQPRRGTLDAGAIANPRVSCMSACQAPDQQFNGPASEPAAPFPPTPFESQPDCLPPSRMQCEHRACHRAFSSGHESPSDR
jgi:hypothetical protein